VTYGLSKELRKHQQEESAQEVDSGDGNVETISLLVHPWAQSGDTDEQCKLDQDKSDSLDLSTALSKADEHGLDEQVSEPWDDEPVGGSLELNVQETPLVESNRIRVEDVGGVLVHGNGALRNADHLGRGPGEYTDHGNDGQNGKDNKTGRVAHSQLPESQHHHLREANENNAEQDSLQHSLPSIAEVDKLVALHLASLDKTLTDVLEGKHADDGEKNEDDEEGVAGEEDVGRLDTGLESHTLDTTENQSFAAELSLGRSRVTTSHKTLGHTDSKVDCLDGTLRHASLLDLDGLSSQLRQMGCGSAAGGALVPGGHLLQEIDADYAHGPLEVLRPGSDNGRQGNSTHADEGLRLEVTKERHGVGGHVSSCVGVSESRRDGGCNQSQTRDDSGDPCDSLLVDRTAVGQLGFNAGSEVGGACVVDSDAHEQVQVGDGVCDAWNLAHDVRAYVVKVGLDGQGSRVHGAHALKLLAGTGVELLGQGEVAVDEELHLGVDLAGDVGDALNVEAQTAVVGRQGDVEERRREGRVGHARVERLRLEDALGGSQRQGGGGEP